MVYGKYVYIYLQKYVYIYLQKYEYIYLQKYVYEYILIIETIWMSVRIGLLNEFWTLDFIHNWSIIFLSWRY